MNCRTPYALTTLAYLALLSVLIGGAGCSAKFYERRADRATRELLERTTEKVLGNRQATVCYPTVSQIEATQEETIIEEHAPRVITLLDALEIALITNREQLSEKESLYLTTLNLLDAKHTFSPQLSAVLSYLFSDATGVAHSQQTGLGLGLSQNLPHGGTLSLSGDTIFDADSSLSTQKAFSSSLGVHLSQPLLR